MEALASWTVLNKEINNFNEEELKSMLDFECMTKNRKDIIKRLHQRYSKLRGQRELRELLK